MFVRTERLLLRPGWVEDAPAMSEVLAGEHVAMALARTSWPYAGFDAEAWLGRERGVHEADMLVFLRTTIAPRLIGGIALADCDGETELGFWTVPSHRSRGFATEAGRAVVAMARDSLRIERLVAGHFIDDPAAGRVLEKLGFLASGTEGRACLTRGRVVPCAKLALDLRAEMAMAA